MSEYQKIRRFQLRYANYTGEGIAWPDGSACYRLSTGRTFNTLADPKRIHPGIEILWIDKEE